MDLAGGNGDESRIEEVVPGDQHPRLMQASEQRRVFPELKSALCPRASARSWVIYLPEAPGRHVATRSLPLRDVWRDWQSAPIFTVVGAAVMGGIATIPAWNLFAGLAVGAAHHVGDGEQSKDDGSALHATSWTKGCRHRFGLPASTVAIKSR